MNAMLRQLLLLIVLVLLWPATARSVSAQTPDNATVSRLLNVDTPHLMEAQALPDEAETCTDLISREIALWRPPVLLDAAGPRGQPQLCLLARAFDDAVSAVMMPIDSAEQFRRAKAAALRYLGERSIDDCRIGTWLFYGRRFDGLTLDDLLDHSKECGFRVITVPNDPQIVGLIDTIRGTVADIVARTGQDLNWRSNRALTIIPTVDVNATIATHLRYSIGESPDETERRARAGDSAIGIDEMLGYVVVLNLSPVPEAARGLGVSQQVAARFLTEIVVAHEYAHFSALGLAGSLLSVHYWFLEGLAEFEEERIVGIALPDRRVAAQVVREGRAPTLASISTAAGWFAQEQRLGSSTVYSYAYAGFAYLVERHGFQATIQLLSQNRHGPLAQFDAALSALTGLSLEGLDQALRQWLTQSR